MNYPAASRGVSNAQTEKPLVASHGELNPTRLIYDHIPGSLRNVFAGYTDVLSHFLYIFWIISVPVHKTLVSVNNKARARESLAEWRKCNRQLGAASCQPLLSCCFVPLSEFRDLVEANQPLHAWVMAPAGNRAHGATRDVPLRRFHAYDRMMKILLNLDFR